MPLSRRIQSLVSGGTHGLAAEEGNLWRSIVRNDHHHVEHRLRAEKDSQRKEYVKVQGKKTPSHTTVDDQLACC